ncbi:DUF5998 family protein [Schaalia sp. lx-260]|uniref:DUF5998 family protein n=1 Tax=Schaalia sp. lx-260 TaxID=2899082 RepID=UPI001E5BE12C|nr:DUF5998 family protein [Schaalia sp. lx-260]MCD4549485.1 DUF5998 family protein [Schaalia sp. lx-260]
MNTRKHIESWGFFPEIVSRALERALGGAKARALIHQLDTDFHEGKFFRHLSVMALSDTVFVHLHVHEYDEGIARVSTVVYALDSLTHMKISEVIERPYHGEGATEIILSFEGGQSQYIDIAPTRCADSPCLGEHGFSGALTKEELRIRVSEAADGPQALENAQTFADQIALVLARKQNNR